jgi:hypothetical protein
MNSAHYTFNLAAGWYGFLGGVLSGMIIGLFFHREGWLGGYDSFPRRMVRLGHIAFFGLGLINILFALSAPGASFWTDVASVSLTVGLITMPLNCFVTAWKKSFRHLFFIPAGGTGLGVVALVITLT